MRLQSFGTLHSKFLCNVPLVNSCLDLWGFCRMQYDRFQAESGWNILTLLGNGHQNLHETYQCRMYSREILMMGREDARNM